MNYKIIFRLLGYIATALWMSFFICLAVEYIFSEQKLNEGWEICIGISMLLSVLFFGLSFGAKVKLFRREALCVIGLGWLLSSAIGAIPYVVILKCSPFDAFFESVSGFTTTGSSAFPDINNAPHGLLFWRCMSQWIGGLGVVVFFAAILSSLGASSKLLFSRESSGDSMELDSSRIQSGLRSIILLYLGLSALCAYFFYYTGVNAFESICHMFSTISTGGFSTRNASVGAFHNPAFEWAAIVFMILGGANFLLMLKLLRKQYRVVLKNTELRAYLIIIVLFSFLVAVLLFKAKPVGFSWYEIEPLIRVSTFQVVTLLTTTGYATTDFNLWVPGTHLLLLITFFIGGCSGSTSGGIKVSRLVASIKIAMHAMEKAFRRHIVRPIFINGKSLDDADVSEIPVFITIVVLLCGLSALCIAIFDSNVSTEGVISATLTCFSNVGPGFAEFGPSSSFASLSNASKALLSLLMLVGRLELYALLVLFMPSFWKRYD